LHSCTLGQKLLYIVSFPSFFDPAVANDFIVLDLEFGTCCEGLLCELNNDKMTDEWIPSAKRQIAQNITSTTQQSNGVVISNHYKVESKS
jgi:hypothetical protein